MKIFIHNKYFLILLKSAYLNLFMSGCFSQKQITLEKGVECKITKIVLKTGEEIDFTEDELGYAYLSDDVIVRVNDDGKSETFSLEEVDKVYTEEFSSDNFGWIIFYGTISVLAIFLIFKAIAPDGVSFGG
jgi:hypothetical protein